MNVAIVRAPINALTKTIRMIRFSVVDRFMVLGLWFLCFAVTSADFQDNNRVASSIIPMTISGNRDSLSIGEFSHNPKVLMNNKGVNQGFRFHVVPPLLSHQLL